jgi:ATP-dependent Clp protease adaptor protein ClpS
MRDHQDFRAGPDRPDTREDGQTATKPKVEHPKMYKVLLHNDDYTTMEFVTEVLMNVFRKSRVEATRIMLSVHRSGKGVAGVYTREIAEAKSGQAMDLARSSGYPLLVTTEPE